MSVRNVVGQTTTVVGTGDRTLDGAAIRNCRTFAAAFADGDTVSATFLDRTTGDTEVGVYTFRTGPNRLVVVEVRLAFGPNANGGATSPVDFVAGTKDALCDVAAEDFVGMSGMMFGTGTDGDATVTTAVQLTRDTYYRNLAIGVGGSIDTNGRRLFISGTLDLTAAAAHAITSSIGAVGGNASGATAGAGGTTGTTDIFRTCGHSNVGQNGGTGAAGIGGGAGQQGAQEYEGGRVFFDYTIARGGAGAGGAGGTAGVPNMTGTRQWLSMPLHLTTWPVGSYALGGYAGIGIAIKGGRGGCGGGAGGGNGVSAGGGGGGGGAGGPVVGVWARRIVVGGSTGTPVISARGRNGGNGANGTSVDCGGGGGGQGGGGGVIYLVAGSIVGGPLADALDASGGTGGNGGDGSGTGIGGWGNCGGGAGLIVKYVLATNEQSVVKHADWASTPANPGTGTAGTAGTAGGVALMDL